jgi:trimethylamine:corrinoid methyltransferase-like protein
MHTFQNFRKSLHTPIIEQKEAYAAWQAKGGEPIEQAANRKWKEILDKYEEPAMSEDVLAELDAYIEKKYGKRN